MDQPKSEQDGRIFDEKGASTSEVCGVAGQTDSGSAEKASPEQPTISANWHKAKGVNREFIDSLKQLRDTMQSQVEAKRAEVEMLREQIRGLTNE